MVYIFKIHLNKIVSMYTITGIKNWAITSLITLKPLIKFLNTSNHKNNNYNTEQAYPQKAVYNY